MPSGKQTATLIARECPLASERPTVPSGQRAEGRPCRDEARWLRFLRSGPHRSGDRARDMRSTSLPDRHVAAACVALCGPTADSDEVSRRFRLKPATCSEANQPVIPTKPAGVAERTASGVNEVSLRRLRQVWCSLWRAACGAIPLSDPGGERCGRAGRARRRRWWDRRYERASSRPAIGW